MSGTAQKIFSYRWAIGFILFCLCVYGEIHGSSIGMYSQLLNTPNINIYGDSRPIRSDEWVVSTPLAFSQYYNDFNYFSNIPRGTYTDMYLVYGQAVKDPAVILRPFHWGYLFLSPAKGLSFFWMGRLILLFLVSLEFGLVFCRRKKLLALVYATILTFSPYVQWWFAVVYIADILIAGQLGVLIVLRYFQTVSIKLRLIYSLCFAYVLGVYTFSVYPAWQVPCGYVFLFVIIGLLSEKWRDIRFFKRDILLISCGLLILVPIVVPIIQKSMPMIEITQNTVYPGSRFQTSGGMSSIFIYPQTMCYALGIFLPSIDVAGTLYGNNCEIARMFDLAPLGLLSAILCLYKGHRDKVLISLLVLQVFFYAWCLFTWPVWFAKISLMYNVTFRVVLGIGLINVLLFCRVAALTEKPFGNKTAISCAFIGALSAVLCFAPFTYTIIKAKYFVTTFIIVGVLWYSFFRKKTNVFSFLMIILLLYSGVRVNPVAHGAESIFASPIVQEIQHITEEDKGLWLVVNEYALYNNIPMMSGAPTINSINIYPDLEKWAKIDIHNQYRSVYNRYAHITAELTMEDTQFKLTQADCFSVKINPRDLRVLNVRYILSKNDLSDITDVNVKLTQIFQSGDFRIYHVENQ